MGSGPTHLVGRLVRLLAPNRGDVAILALAHVVVQALGVGGEVDRSALRDVEVVVKSREMAKGLYYNRPTANRRASRRRRHAAVGDGGWAVTLRLARLLGWEGGERRTGAGTTNTGARRAARHKTRHTTRAKKGKCPQQVSGHLYTRA